MPLSKNLAIAVTAISLLTCAPATRAQYGPPQGAYGQEGWNVPPREYREYARKGYFDGIEGARRDVENHRRPNVNNRDEFRRPNVPGQFRRDYRQGFKRGYDVSMQHLRNGSR